MKHVIVGTAGHIDHGKTTLVRALTGIDTDRLKEEKLRGITIELGFAHLDLPGAPPVGIVDVPGHEKFVHHMVAGVAGIDLVLLVIAADEGIMPQTREHLDICRLLGVRAGLVALTKSDMVEPDWMELVRDEVRDFTAGTFLDGRPVIAVSSTTGEGVDTLRDALAAAVAAVPNRPPSSLPRLPIDRIFTMKGFGTVVTGTLFSGTLNVGDTVEVLPPEVRTRIRGLQAHGAAVTTIEAGQRAAVNLQGVEKQAIGRGDTLTHPGALSPTYLMDAHLELLRGAPRPLRHRTRVRLHFGTSEILARVVIPGREDLPPGDAGMVQFRLESPGIALPRDRFVIRSYSPIVTIGGGSLVDTHPRKHKKSSTAAAGNLQVLAEGDDRDKAALLLREAGPAGLDPQSLSVRLNLEKSESLAVLSKLTEDGTALRLPGSPPLFIHAETAAAFDRTTLSLLEAYHAEHPLKPGLSKEELKSRHRGAAPRVFIFLLQRIAGAGSVAVEKNTVRLAAHRISLRSDQEQVKEKVEAYLRRAGLQPPVEEVILSDLGLERRSFDEAVSLLAAEGALVKVKEGMHMHAEAVRPLREKLAAYLGEHGQIAMPEFKDLSGISRKYSIPVMEFFDRTGVTIRVGDHRVLRKTT